MNHVIAHFEAACAALSLEPGRVISGTGMRDGPDVRQHAQVYHWMRSRPLQNQRRGPSLLEIGAVFGRHHSSVLHALRTHPAPPEALAR